MLVRLARVLRRRVQAHHVAGLHLEIFQRDGRRAGRRLRARRRAAATVFSGAAVHGVVQLDVLQAEIVLGFDRDRDFFDRRRLEIAARPRDLDLRRLVLLRLDEVIFAEPDVLAAFDGGDVIHAVLLDRHAGHQHAVGAAAQRELRSVVQHRIAVRQRPVGLDRDLRGGAFHRAQIAARIFHRVLHARATPGNDR